MIDIIKFIRMAPKRSVRILKSAWQEHRNRSVAKPPDLFDNEMGIDTKSYERIYSLDALNSSYYYSSGYEPSRSDEFMECVQSLPVDRSAFHFIDVGCGKGRILILAHKAGFKEVSGVELSPSLAEKARENTEACGVPATIRLADARAFQVPDIPCVLYLFNPFDGAVMRDFLRAVKARLDRSSEDLWLIYVHAACEKMISNTGMFRIHKKFPFGIVYARPSSSESRVSLPA